MSDVVQHPTSNRTSTQPTHPFEQAAQLGFGPLSPKTQEVWHGDSTPCVSCGLLNRRGSDACRHCRQDLTQTMLEKMAKHSGPWFVYDHIRPFPGVALERMLLQIKRGVLTRISIVRGPTTYYQWRYAGETPILSKFLGVCWNCQKDVVEQERYCPHCKVVLDGCHKPQQLSLSGSPEAAMELERLGRAVQESSPAATTPHRRQGERTLGKAPLVFFIIATLVVMGIVTLITISRNGASSGLKQSFLSPPPSAIIPA